MTKDTTFKWAVYGVQKGNLGRIDGRQARFTTRSEARVALREGRVYIDPTKGRVDHYPL